MTTNYQSSGSALESVLLRRDLFSQGGVWNWGFNLNNNLGDGTSTSRSSPVQTLAGGITWKLISSGGYSTLGIKTDGTLWGWGVNNYGQLGTGNTTQPNSPVSAYLGSSSWVMVSTGYFQSAAIKSDGTLWLTGRNYYGGLGDNTSTTRNSPVQTIAGGTNWKYVNCGFSYGNTAAIKTDGTLWTWGYNGNGQLGDNTSSNRSSPVQTIASGTNWKQSSCGYNHMGAIKTDGTLWLWGNNTYGQLGDNTSGNQYSSPIQTVAGGTNWKTISCGYNHTTAVKTDGTLWVWGRNHKGQLGDNTRTSRSSPVQTISGGTNWKSVIGGYYHTAAIKTDGTLWLWGSNKYYGEIGDNTNVDKSSPVQTVAGGTNWKLVSCGRYTTAGTTDIF